MLKLILILLIIVFFICLVWVFLNRKTILRLIIALWLIAPLIAPVL